MKTQFYKSRKGASVVEYAALLSLIGGLTVGAVFSFGEDVKGNTETINTALNERLPINGPSSPGTGTAGGQPEQDGTESFTQPEPPAQLEPPAPPPPLPVVMGFGWFQGAAYAFPMGNSGPYSLTNGATVQVLNMPDSLNPGVNARLTHAQPEEPYTIPTFSGARITRTATMSPTLEVYFQSPVESLGFRIADMDGIGGSIDRVIIQGITTDGNTIYPTTASPLVSSLGAGQFQGFPRFCAESTVDCSPFFIFAQPLQSVSITLTGTGSSGFVDVSDFAGIVYQ